MTDHRRRPQRDQSTSSFRLTRAPSAQLRRRNDRPNAPFYDWTRILQWTFLLAVTIAAGVLTYHYSSQRLEDEFSTEFRHVSNQVTQESSYRLNNQYSFLESLSLAVTASTLSQHWPLITIPNFDALAQNYLNHSQAQIIAFAPLVYGPNITAWEDYASGEGITNYTYKIENGLRVQDVDSPSTPLWQISPDRGATSIKYNLLQTSWINQLVQASLQQQQPILSEPLPPEALFSVFPRVQSPDNETWSILAQPVFAGMVMDSSEDGNNNDNNNPGEIGGFLFSILPWSAFFRDILWHEEESVICVIRDSLNYAFSYQLVGSEARYLGSGDSFHDRKWDVIASPFPKPSIHDAQRQRGRQLQYASSYSYALKVYPTHEFYDYYVTDEPWIYASIVAAILLGVALWFLCCDCFRKRLENNVGASEEKMMDGTIQPGGGHFARGPRKSTVPENNKQRLTAFLADSSSPSLSGLMEEEEDHTNLDTSTDDYGDFDLAKSKPIADFFPDASVLLADISGFTAWSSVREPSQVFFLLENIYHAFDAIAKRRKVLKVDTIGDCYVAVCGLPEPRPDHSLRMCQYARSCLRKFRLLSHRLEEKLGPETSELDLRIGISTGAITAGIVRGHTARFQLFGETVWRATKIESTGEGGRIHLSKETANQLTLAGKGHWLQRRRDTIHTETGEIQTFWLLDENSLKPALPSSSHVPGQRTLSQESGSGESTGDSSFGEDDGWEDNCEQSMSCIQVGVLRAANEHSKDSVAEGNSKMKRLIGWNCEVILPLLKMIVARREAEKKLKGGTEAIEDLKKLERKVGSTKNVLDEVEEVINLPEFDSKIQKRVKSDPDKVKLGLEVETQLREYVTLMASLYRKNPFHNFEHASHVTMSMTKLLGRIIAPDQVIDMFGNKKKSDMASSLHDYTYGITSDPLTQFAAVMSALIHDVDHRGIPNFLLIREDPELVAVYYNKSVAEQNSVDIAWEALMDPRFEALRDCIYSNETELKRFRQLLVNSVMATDIFDKELSALRKNRWEKAFKVPNSNATQEDINRKATIVIEHLIQASDVSHTMQHWHIYKKWNERLFQELYTAYRLGRSDKDPSSSWYQGEISFFDNYVIPLAKKLKDCGVFGVSSEEYLNYATANRNEWEAKGKEIVEGMIDKYSVMMDVA